MPHRSALFAAFLLCLAGAASAETVHSLDQVPGHLGTPEARAAFATQIEGKPAPDLLGVRSLPPGLPAAAIAGMLVPPADHAAPRLVGARHWRDDLYVAIVCTGGPPLAAGDTPDCASYDPAAALHVYLGVIALTPGAAPRLVAASGAWDTAMGWDDTLLPRAPAAADDADGKLAAPPSFDGFDLAPYRIAPGVPAFGLRCGWQEGYSGGSASFTGLYLFAIDGTRLRRVLAAPMSAFADIAGDWHKDGTRDHDITDAANLLIVSPRQTGGHFNLMLRLRGGHGQQLYRWSAAGGYRLATKP